MDDEPEDVIGEEEPEPYEEDPLRLSGAMRLMIIIAVLAMLMTVAWWIVLPPE